MFGFLLLLFVCVPIIEIWLLIRIGQAIHAGPTIALVILTGIIGAALARREGARTLFRIQETMGRGEIPAQAMVEGVLVFVAGLLLVTPGVLTDCAGFLLLLPPVRAVTARKLVDHFRSRVILTGPGVHVEFRDFHARSHNPYARSDDAPLHSDIIDVAYHDVTQERTPRLHDGDDQPR